MSAFWIVAIVVAAATAALVLFPLIRGRREGAAPDRADYDIAVFKDQLAEVDRDLERGLLDRERADAARLEIQRRVLAERPARDAASDTAAAEPAQGRRRRSPLLAAALAGAVAVGSFGLYWQLGAPDAPDAPLASRGAPVGRGAAVADADGGDDLSALTMEQAVAQLRQRMEAEPGRLDGWLLLGRSYLAMERYADAAEAYRRAVELSDGRPDVAGDYGEALVAAANGTVSLEAVEMFRTALAGDPADAKARYYLALAAAQQGDLASALQGWVDVVVLSPADAPWLAAVQQQVARAATALGVDTATLKPSPEVAALVEGMARGQVSGQVRGQAAGPTREEMAAAAAMSDEERTAMIRSMVERLAARLEDQPDDRMGWLRLARAYDVLGEEEKAKEARARAAALDPR